MRLLHLGAAGLLLVGFAMVAFDSGIGAQTSPGPRRWPIAGRDLDNSRSQPLERQISTENVHQLVPKWVFTTGSDVSATPTVAGNAVYFPDWAGNLFAVRADNGDLLWSHQISDYTGVPETIARVSPAIFEDLLIIGDHNGVSWLSSAAGAQAGAHVIAIDRHSGALRWITQVDAHPAAVITGSPVFHETAVYVGVSSQEEGLADNPAYPCCTFRGNMVALDVFTGEMLWKTFTVPDNMGLTNQYSGNAIWSPPAIDPGRGSLYIGVGNNYTVPDAVLQCHQEAIASGNPNPNCDAPDNFIETVLALDLATGAIKWSHQLSAFDAWTVACPPSSPAPAPVGNCPALFGPDFDFPGSGPNLLHLPAQPEGPATDLVGIGQKSGIYWALNPDNGAIVWSTSVGPGGTTGGIQWGRRLTGPAFTWRLQTLST